MFHLKTDSGREEIRARQLKLSRSARTLLLILEPSRPTEEWLQMVRGATAEDVRALQSLGLITLAAEGAPAVHEEPAAPPLEEAAAQQPAAAQAAPAASIPASPSMAAPAPSAPTPAAAPVDLGALSQRCTQLATRHLGLLESYRMVLEIERCSSVAELQALAPRLLSAVERQVGAERAQRLRAELGLDVSAAPR